MLEIGSDMGGEKEEIEEEEKEGKINTLRQILVKSQNVEKRRI